MPGESLETEGEALRSPGFSRYPDSRRGGEKGEHIHHITPKRGGPGGKDAGQEEEREWVYNRRERRTNLGPTELHWDMVATHKGTAGWILFVVVVGLNFHNCISEIWCNLHSSHDASNPEFRGGHKNAHLPESALTLGRTVQQHFLQSWKCFVSVLIQEPLAKCANWAFEMWLTY